MLDVLQLSPYTDEYSLTSVIKFKQHDFKIISLNCQSLSAKIDNFKILMHNLDNQQVYIDAICLQESWLSDLSDLSLLGVVHNCHHFHERTQRTLFCDPLPPYQKRTFKMLIRNNPYQKGRVYVINRRLQTGVRNKTSHCRCMSRTLQSLIVDN